MNSCDGIAVFGRAWLNGSSIVDLLHQLLHFATPSVFLGRPWPSSSISPNWPPPACAGGRRQCEQPGHLSPVADAAVAEPGRESQLALPVWVRRLHGRSEQGDCRLLVLAAAALQSLTATWPLPWTQSPL
jgi:hypothetical protein